MELINLLVAHGGTPTLVCFLEGDNLIVHNIAWGYDLGDEYAHVTTNVSPSLPSAPIDFFITDGVRTSESARDSPRMVPVAVLGADLSVMVLDDVLHLVGPGRVRPAASASSLMP
jgi:hypothetical protein